MAFIRIIQKLLASGRHHNHGKIVFDGSQAWRSR
jgi:hypothetical protein